jgi:hypothetical protein
MGLFIMISNLYVIDQGVCIYNFDFSNRTPIDQQLLTGLPPILWVKLQAVLKLESDKTYLYPSKGFSFKV